MHNSFEERYNVTSSSEEGESEVEVELGFKLPPSVLSNWFAYVIDPPISKSQSFQRQGKGAYT
jgi:hypothetical protein